MNRPKSLRKCSSSRFTALSPARWTKDTASDLRRLLIRTMEQHAERRFLTVPLLEAL